MPYDARAVANLMLDDAERLTLSLSHMALQKILFFAHGWYLATHNKPLIKQNFEAWEHGPVIRVVYDAFKDVGDRPIADRAVRLDPVTRVESVVLPDLAADDAAFVGHVVRRYGPVHAFELRRLTHLPGTPWHQVWNAGRGSVVLGMKIPDETIRTFFAADARAH